MKKFKIDQVKTIVKGYVIETYHIEASSKEEALKLFEEQKDDLESVDSDIYIKDTEWVGNEIEEIRRQVYQNKNWCVLYSPLKTIEILIIKTSFKMNTEDTNKDLTSNDAKPMLTTVALSELEESNRNGMEWFNSYQDIDNFLFDELDKKGLEFVTEFEKPELNTIASIKLLMCNCC